jgi:hypothetical protein
VTDGPDIRPVQDAYLSFLRQQYSYNPDLAQGPPVGCVGVQSVGESQSILKVYIDRDRNNKKKVVETGWKYGTAQNIAAAPVTSQAAQPASVTPPPAAPSSAVNSSGPLFKGYCFSSTDDPVVYRTDIFQTAIPSKPSVSNRDSAPLRDAFLEYLNKKYAFKSTSNFAVVCHLNDENRIETTRQNMETQWQRGKKQVIATGWTYDVAPATPAPSAVTLPPGVDPALAQEPGLPQLSPEVRQAALNEVGSSRNYCQTNGYLSGLMDCSCFSKAVLDYRIAHPDDTVHRMNALRDVVTFTPLVNLIGVGKLDVSQCLPADRISKWAVDQVRSPSQLPQSFYDCVGTTTARLFEAEPFIKNVTPFYNQAVTSCTKNLSAAPATAPAPRQAVQPALPRTVPQAPPSRPAGAPVPLQTGAPAAPVGAGGPQMRELSARYNALLSRATDAKAGVAQMEQRLAADGLGLRADIRDARNRLDTQLKTADGAIARGDADSAEENLRYAENALGILEKFVGR